MEGAVGWVNQWIGLRRFSWRWLSEGQTEIVLSWCVCFVSEKPNFKVLKLSFWWSTLLNVLRVRVRVFVLLCVCLCLHVMVQCNNRTRIWIHLHAGVCLPIWRDAKNCKKCIFILDITRADKSFDQSFHSGESEAVWTLIDPNMSCNPPGTVLLSILNHSQARDVQRALQSAVQGFWYFKYWNKFL